MSRFVFCFFVAAALATAPLSGSAYKVGYKGIPVIVDDLPAVHEKVTAEGVRHFCETYGLEELVDSPISVLLFEDPPTSCEDLSFSPDMGNWSSRMKNSPIKGVLLGSRYPDLREMAGIDSNMMDYVVVKHDDEVQVDVYRLDPTMHGQLSKYHNVFGGDMNLGARVFRDYVAATFYELLHLSWAQTGGKRFANTFVAANAMTKHDTGASTSDLLWTVPWSQVTLGALCHAYQDAVSHDPLIVLDVPNNRIVFAALFYGKFQDEFGNERSITDLYHAIDHEMKPTTDGLSENHHIVRHTPEGPLELFEIPETSKIDGEQRVNFFALDDTIYASGQLVTSLAMYAVAELLGALHEASLRPGRPGEVAEILSAYLDKWVFFDTTINAGYIPVVTQDIGASVPEYETLPWYNYSFVDLWKHSGLADRTIHGKGAFYLPWSDPMSMDGMLESSFTARFVVQPGDVEEYDETAEIFWLDRKKLYLFESWFRTTSGDVASVELEGLFDVGDFSEVAELEVDVDEAAPGLDEVYAFAWIPQGYRVCIHSPPNHSAKSQGARAAAYDETKELYRCFYGGSQGRIATMNFHLRRGSTLHVLPIDTDGDQVPYLRGYSQALYADNCPSISNPNQADGDGDGVGDRCDKCPVEIGSLEGMGCPDEDTQTDFDTDDGEDDTDAGTEKESDVDSGAGSDTSTETHSDAGTQADSGADVNAGPDNKIDSDGPSGSVQSGCIMKPFKMSPRGHLLTWIIALFP